MNQRLARLAACSFALLSLALALAPRGGADVPARERELLERAAAPYRNPGSYRLEGTFVVESFIDGESQRVEAPLRLAGRRPDRMREELVHPQLGQVMLSDGTDTWIYRAALGQYVKRPGAVPPATDSASTAVSGAVTRGLFTMLRDPLTGATEARTLAPETLSVAGRRAVCTVIEVEFPAARRTYWIEPRTGRFVRHRVTSSMVGGRYETRRSETVTYDRVELDAALPDTLFVFRAPAGARETATFQPPRPDRPDLSGQKAADFTLADLAGKKHRLSAQRGKVVMLDFWATWCGPCRIQMPNVEKLHREYKGKGLVVYAINQRESAETAQRYLKRYAYTTMTLLDPDGVVGEQYKVNGIPSLFVIDREGTISAHFVGVRGEDDLRAALKKAGLQ